MVEHLRSAEPLPPVTLFGVLILPERIDLDIYHVKSMFVT